MKYYRSVFDFGDMGFLEICEQSHGVHIMGDTLTKDSRWSLFNISNGGLWLSSYISNHREMDYNHRTQLKVVGVDLYD